MGLDFGFIFLFIASTGAAVSGNILLKAGVTRLGNFNLTINGLLPTFLALLGNWQLILGFALYGFSSILYLKLLTTGEVTKIYPMLVSFMFVLLLIMGSIFLKESFTITKVLGIAVIILGIFIGSR
jgi:uncharacterized membrane protein